MKFLALFLAAHAAPAVACAVPSPPPEAFTAWNERGRALPNGGTLQVGKAALIMLVNRKQAGFVVPPGREPPRATNGGVFTIEIRRAGTYQVALSDRAWIDLARDGKTVESTTHDHGGLCTGIAKIVGFDLTPGRYSLQLSGTASQTSKVMVVRTR